MEIGFRFGSYAIAIALLPSEFLLGIATGNYLAEDGPSRELQIGAVFAWFVFRKYEKTH